MSQPNALLSQWYGTGEVKQASVPVSHDIEKQAAANVQEADFLGRVVAHAYVDEMHKLSSAEEPQVNEELDAAAEKVAMDILHESGTNPFTFQPYQSMDEKVATAQWWDEQVKQAQAEQPVDYLRAVPAGQDKIAAAEPSDEVKQIVLEHAWSKLAQHGFSPAPANQ